MITVKAFIIIILVSIAFATAGQQLPRALIITGNGNIPVGKENYPPWVHAFHNATVMKILNGIVAVDTTADLGLLNDKTLQGYDLVISNSIFLTPTPSQLDALYSFVSSGKSYLTLHCGILSLLNWSKYEELVGGIFIGGPSTEPERFPVITENWEFWGYPYAFRTSTRHPVSAAVGDFTIHDEMYYFQPSTPEFYVIARAENHPIMWWHPVGKGRSMSLTLGHSQEAKGTPGYQQLLTNGVRWLTGYPLFDEVHLAPLSTRTKSYPAYLDLAAITHDPKAMFRIVSNSNENVLKATLGQGGTVDVSVTEAGSATLRIMTTTSNGLATQKDFTINVVPDGRGNIAAYQGNRATKSSSDTQIYSIDAANVIDGDLGTRWSSAVIDPSWLALDLKQEYRIQRVTLHWEDSFAIEYSVLVSKTGKDDWTSVAEIKHSDGKTDALSFDAVQARYVKIVGKKRSRPLYGYSLYEVEVYQE
jgi:type 1 glutamine amidotransferase